jgi:hypothetical protein
VVAFPVNRWLITRGKGHAVLHETGIHGGPPTRLVAFIAAAAAVFGTAVLVGEAVGDGNGGGHGRQMAAAHGAEKEAGHSEDEGTTSGKGHGGEAQDPVRGLAVAEGGLKLELERTEVPRGRPTELRFRIRGEDGQPVRDFEVEHDKRMHLIVARRDLTGFQHLHPKLADDGEWSTPLKIEEAGSYRVFADFKRGGKSETLASDLAVDGPADFRALPAVAPTADTDDGYQVRLDGAGAKAAKETELGFTVTRGGQKVHVEDYLGAKGHLVALREGDLAYLHVHPVEAGHGGEAKEDAAHDDAIRFATEFPSDGRYRLFLQFKAEGKVHTAAFTEEVAR